MPFIDSKVSISMMDAQEKELKTRLGEAVSLIGKSEAWLMTGFQDNYHLYFKGDNSQPMAFVEVMLYGGENPGAFDRMTGKICEIFQDVLGVAPDHVYVKYSPAQSWGWNGRNF